MKKHVDPKQFSSSITQKTEKVKNVASQFLSVDRIAAINKNLDDSKKNLDAHTEHVKGLPDRLKASSARAKQSPK